MLTVSCFIRFGKRISCWWSKLQSTLSRTLVKRCSFTDGYFKCRSSFSQNTCTNCPCCTPLWNWLFVADYITAYFCPTCEMLNSIQSLFWVAHRCLDVIQSTGKQYTKTQQRRDGVAKLQWFTPASKTPVKLKGCQKAPCGGKSTKIRCWFSN